MTKEIKAPKAPKAEPRAPKVKPIKTYTSKGSPKKRFRVIKFFFWAIIIAIIGLSILTWTVGPIKVAWFNPPELNLPKQTNSKTLTVQPYETSIIKYIQIQNNNRTFTVKNQPIKLPLKEGINNFSAYYLYDFKLFRLKSKSIKFQINRDTLAPQLLKKPTLTNQGLVLEFTEPAKVKVGKYTYKTDSSYTVVIPKLRLKNNKLNISVIDSLGNTKTFTIILKKATTPKNNNEYVVTGENLPESAGIQDYLNISVLALIVFTLALPYVLVNRSLKNLWNKA